MVCEFPVLFLVSILFIGWFLGYKTEDLRNDYLIRKSEIEGMDYWDK